MAIIGATELQPVNVVSNYLAGQEARRNQLAQQQQLAMQQQQMAMQQRAAQREEAAAAEEAQRNSLLRSTLAGGGDSQALMQAGLFEPAIKLGQYEASQAETTAKAQERAMKQRQALFGVISVARNPETYQTARQIAEGMGMDLTGIPEEYPGEEAITAIEDALLTPAERADRAAKRETAAIQRGQLAQAGARLRLDQMQFNEQVRQFGIKNQQELEKLQRESPEFLAKIEQMKAAGKYEGERLTKARMDLPDALAKADEAVRLIDEMVGKEGAKGAEGRPHPGFRGAVGAGFGTRFIPGTPAASFQSRYEQVTGSAFLQAYETLKGTGQITEIEGAKATAAITRMQLSASEKEFVEAAREFQRVIRAAAKRRAEAAGAAAPAPGSATRQTASGTSYTIEE
jgi:hypothetical protein